ASSNQLASGFVAQSAYGATGRSAPRQSPRDKLIGRTESDAPAVLFSVLEGSLHLLIEDFQEHRGAHGLAARLIEIRRAISGTEHPRDGLFHPVSFQAQSKRVAKHHRGTEDRADGICRVLPGE